MRRLFEALVESIKGKPTPEMVHHFNARTNRHIALVQKYAAWMEPLVPGLEERCVRHDFGKWAEPERTPYIWLTWRYKCKDDGVKFEGPPGIDQAIERATLHHILGNSHHPEAHQDRTDGLLAKDRDEVPEETIDASRMGDVDIAEMVADWCAMSEERGNTPREWAAKVVGTRWKFTLAQEKRIYDLIDFAWKGRMK